MSQRYWELLKLSVRTTPPNLAKLISESPRNARGPMTEAASWELVGNTRRGLKHYPLKPKKSRYKRTYILREGWGFTKYGAAIKVINPVKYAPYVQGDKEQAWMHKGLWDIVSVTVEKNWERMVAAAEKALSKYLKSKGL